MNKLKILYIVDGNVNWSAASMENSIEVPLKVKNGITISSSNSICGYISKRIEISILKKYLRSHVYRSLFYIGKI